ncbi:glycosyltransferase family 4 protein [Candidatus Kuenenbacteria bacterium]|nr:glycosyltransferase family 4 protein [Candidatus Kuenenbacteria bacterium]
MSIALIHDYLVQLGGAEKVLLSLGRVFPNSPIFVMLHDREKIGSIFPPQKIYSSWLQKMPFAKSHYQWYLTLMPKAASSHQLDSYNIIVSSASSFAKNIKKNKDAVHFCYCHTPTRYLWHDHLSYVEDLNYPFWVKKLIPLFLPRLRHLDLVSARQVDYFIANSKTVQERIQKYYGRDSVVIYPPVATHDFEPSEKIDNYFLAGGRLVAYKKYDLTIKTFNKLGIKLKIFGTGPEKKRLQKMAYKNIKFLGAVDDSAKNELYRHCLAYIHPQLEDFGITAVEAMAAGRPVIAFGAGGALETIIPGKTGEFFPEQTWEALAYQILHFQPEKYNSVFIKNHAEKFSTERFETEIKNYIYSVAQI